MRPTRTPVGTRRLRRSAGRPPAIGRRFVGFLATATLTTAALAAAFCLPAGPAAPPPPASPGDPPAAVLAAAEPSAAEPSAVERAAPVTTPITGGLRGHPFLSLVIPPVTAVAAAGYEESEYQLEGEARPYRTAGARSADGYWQASPGEPAPYRTRLLIERPRDPARFNGTVVVEWLNVTATTETPTDFGYAHQELVRGGYAWVGVSAQSVGVNGLLGLRAWDRARYGSLSHPGDAYSYDIFTDAARAVRNPDGPLRGLPVATVLADGESQSAARLLAYLNAVHPLVPPADRFDGFLVHSRGPYAAPLGDSSADAQDSMRPTLIRTDLDVPVLVVEAESDVRAGPFTYLDARQPDTAYLRTWEVAGTAHLDRFVMDFVDPLMARELNSSSGKDCAQPVNDAPQYLVMNSAVRLLARWARDGTPPPQAPRITTTPDGRIARDEDGNALGGVRLPALDVPTATLSGEGEGLCVLFGATTPLDGERLAQLYPDLGSYEQRLAEATQAGVDGGFLLPEDAAALLGH
ncbi:alpha/beta hydrolase domain-containing protein [Parafrankia elaeagni]|uniref:alpha/beta hydrolase domain-containing protein n=1 Tax=Parafrankia elaeagni TaxID=222534 RepID=UPI000369F935|nr:alpha/beta hydrolase domain-containing protein [Parafrankia elaeagni]